MNNKYCEHCKKDIGYKNWAKHLKSKTHIKKSNKKEDKPEVLEDFEEKWEDPMDLGNGMEVINLLDLKEEEEMEDKQEEVEDKREEVEEYKVKLLDGNKREKLEDVIINLLREDSGITLTENIKFREISDILINKIKNMSDQELIARVKYIKLNKTKKLRNKFYDTFKDGVGFSFNTGIKYLFGLDDKFVLEQEDHPEVVDGLLSVNDYLPSSFKTIIDELVSYPWLLSFGITGINVFKSFSRIGFEFLGEEEYEEEIIQKEEKVLEVKEDKIKIVKEKNINNSLMNEIAKYNIQLPPRPPGMSNTEWDSILINVLENIKSK